MGIEQLMDPKHDFLVVKHRVLNNPNPPFELETDRLFSQLANAANGRRIIPVFEGDYFQPPWAAPIAGGIILAHKSYAPSQHEFEKLQHSGLGSSLAELLVQYSFWKERVPGMVLCFEAKWGTTPQATKALMAQLREHGISRAYIDSFFGRKLEIVHDENAYGSTVASVQKSHNVVNIREAVEWNVKRITYPTSLHVSAKIGSYKLAFGHSKSDIVTVPYAQAFFTRGTPEHPVVYGAVGKIDHVKRAADDPYCLGVYWRGDERGSVVRMFLNSIGARKRF